MGTSYLEGNLSIIAKMFFLIAKILYIHTLRISSADSRKIRKSVTFITMLFGYNNVLVVVLVVIAVLVSSAIWGGWKKSYSSQLCTQPEQCQGAVWVKAILVILSQHRQKGQLPRGGRTLTIPFRSWKKLGAHTGPCRHIQKALPRNSLLFSASKSETSSEILPYEIFIKFNCP